MKYTLPLSCVFSAVVFLSACQTNSPLNGMMPMSSHVTKAQCIATGMTFDRNEIAAAKLAKKRAVNHQVRQYANYLYNHHMADLSKKSKMVRREHLKLEASNMDADLKNRGAQEMAMLEASSRQDFDRNFINQMVKDHQGAIQYFDARLSNETNPHVIRKLKEARRCAEICLGKAQHIQSTMHY